MMTGTAREHTAECRRRLEECSAGDEETKFRSEAAELPVDGWLGVAQRQQLQQAAAAADPYQRDGVRDHGVKRVRSLQVQGTREFL